MINIYCVSKEELDKRRIRPILGKTCIVKKRHEKCVHLGQSEMGYAGNILTRPCILR